MFPHLSVHRRRDQDLGAGGKGDGGERVTGEPVREFRQNVRCRRRDEEQVRAIGQIDVAGPPAFLLSKKLVVTGFFESVCRVSGVMNSTASRVMTTKTSCPCFTSRLASSADL
jgi:hypothetical protein